VPTVESIYKAFDKTFAKIPTWAKAIFFALTILGCAWYIARFGFFHFILRMIFSP